MSKSLLIACIPAYNEERSIAAVLIKTKKYVDKIIVCDDGSDDLTSIIAQELGAIVVRHPNNLGKGEAIRTAFLKALDLSADIIVTFDGDGQHDPDEIPRIIEPILSRRAEVSIGSRFLLNSLNEVPLHRRIGITLLDFFYSIFNNNKIYDTQSGFRAFSSQAAQMMLNTQSKGYGIEFEQLFVSEKKGINIVEVPVFMRYKGLPNTSKKHAALQGFDIIDSLIMFIVEDRPFLFLTLPGVLCFLFGIGLIVHLVWVRTFIGGNVSYDIVTILLLLFVGLFLIILSFLFYTIKHLKYSITLLRRNL